MSSSVREGRFVITSSTVCEALQRNVARSDSDGHIVSSEMDVDGAGFRVDVVVARI